jgi:GMC oxidoreductase
MLGSLGMHPGHLAHRFAYMKTDIPIAGCAHQAGTVRFGSDPATSVLNPDCRAHEVDNLYVVDTSFFPSISAVNPRPDRDGQRRPRRRPPAPTPRLSTRRGGAP